jgi:hypothetical protein
MAFAYKEQDDKEVNVACKATQGQINAAEKATEAIYAP